MLIEQAFFNLPEIMVGNGYAKQEYEGGIVSAFSLSLLQEFKGRNIANPISNIYAEKTYLSDTVQSYIKRNCAFRCDLYVNLSRTNLNNDNLYTYGFREYNYIEAKFFRNSKENSTFNVYSILLDLYRLQILSIYKEPSFKTKLTNLGRYFLHVYKGKPIDYIGNKFNWLNKCAIAGNHNLTIDLQENSSQFNNFPQLIKSKINITNLVIEYYGDSDLYTFVLTRINHFNIEFPKRNDKGKDFYKVNDKGEVSSLNLLNLIKIFIDTQNITSNEGQFNEKIYKALSHEVENYLNCNNNQNRIKNIRNQIKISKKVRVTYKIMKILLMIFKLILRKK